MPATLVSLPHQAGTLRQRSKEKDKDSSPILGTWNVRTRFDNDKSERPQRRTALVARELHRKKNRHVALMRLGLQTKANSAKEDLDILSTGSCEVPRETGINFDIKIS